MRVVLPLVSAAHHISGVQRHAINAAVSLLKSADVTRVHLIAGAWQKYVLSALPAELLRDPRLEIEFCATGNTMIRRNGWYYGQLPGICRVRDAEIVHLAYPMPVRRRAFAMPLVLTLHDLYPYDLPDNFGFPKVLFNRAVLRQCLRSVDAVACVSTSTRMRLDALKLENSFTRTLVIPNAVERNVAIPSRPAALRPEERFLLCIAQHRRNKNILLLLRSYVHLLQTEPSFERTHLVIVGIHGPETPAIHRFLSRHALQGQVKLLSGLSEEELRWCYERCCVLVAPSSVEGFGLPVAEGILAGCRVVCSDIPAHREIGGHKTRFVPLTEDAEQALAAAIREEFEAPKPSPATLHRFTTDSVGRAYSRLYQSLLAVHPSAAAAQKIKIVHAKERELEV